MTLVRPPLHARLRARLAELLDVDVARVVDDARFVEDLGLAPGEGSRVYLAIECELGRALRPPRELRTVREAIEVFEAAGPSAAWLAGRERASRAFPGAPSAGYAPFLRGWPDDYDARWEYVRELLRRWHGLDLPEPVEVPPRLADAEWRHGFPMPRSVQHWVRLLDQLEHADAWFRVLRDAPSLTMVPGFSAISILATGEGDGHWGFRLDAEIGDDPPVYLFALDHDTGAFTPRARTATTSEWALSHVLEHLRLGGGHGFQGTYTDPLGPLVAQFSGYLVLSSTCILEDQDALVLLQGRGPYRVQAHARTERALDTLRRRLPLSANVSW